MRLVQLTALAYCIGFVTDVFDDGASARMDGTTEGHPGRAASENLGDALTPPPAPASPTTLEPTREVDATTLDDRAAVQRFMPRECVHSVADGRPKLTHNEQKRTQRVIAHVAKRLKASDEFLKLLQLVAMRESSMQQGLVHRLSPDLEGSYSAWRKMQKTYEGNPHADEPGAWQTYGLFGMNSNYFTLIWDKAADPRVLCDAVVDVLVYRRAAARMIRKAGGNIVCKDERGQPYNYTTKATWETIHRAVSGGKLCPSKHEATAATMKKFFRSRAERVGIDPDRPVTLKMLGIEPDRGLDGQAWADQDAMVMGLWAEVEAEEVKLATREAEAAELAAERAATKEATRATRVATRKIPR
jgi:hypothetical protein